MMLYRVAHEDKAIMDGFKRWPYPNPKNYRYYFFKGEAYLDFTSYSTNRFVITIEKWSILKGWRMISKMGFDYHATKETK